MVTAKESTIMGQKNKTKKNKNKKTYTQRIWMED
jgi:hypothetical protein